MGRECCFEKGVREEELERSHACFFLPSAKNKRKLDEKEREIPFPEAIIWSVGKRTKDIKGEKGKAQRKQA